MTLPPIDDGAIRVATRDEAATLIATCTLAFGTDPMARYWWSDPASYLRVWPEFSFAMGERAFDHGSAFVLGDGAAAALWLPPGVEPDPERLAALDFGGTEEDAAKSAELRAEQARYKPADPHWYLWLIGVDPTRQGRGLGSALLAHTLRLIDERGETAFLESSDPRNVPLYERHGFVVTGEIRVRDIPVLTPMIRRPR
jgi:ribosomal protein S18 acetylase RimI-like enzyme